MGEQDKAERLQKLGKFVENVAVNEGWAGNDTVLELLGIARHFEAEAAKWRKRAEDELVHGAETRKERNAARDSFYEMQDKATGNAKIASDAMIQAKALRAALDEAAREFHSVGHCYARHQPTFESCEKPDCTKFRAALTSADGAGGTRPNDDEPTQAKSDTGPKAQPVPVKHASGCQRYRAVDGPQFEEWCDTHNAHWAWDARQCQAGGA